MKLKEYVYQRPDIDAYRTSLRGLIEQLKQAQDASQAIDVVQKINKQRGHIQSLMTLAQIRHSMNTLDPEYEQENDFWDEQAPFIEEVNTEFYQAVLDSNYIQALREKLPEPFFGIMKCALNSFSPEIIEDLQKENKLTSEYGRLKGRAQISFRGEVLTLAQIGAYLRDPDRTTRKQAAEAVSAFYLEHLETFDRIYDELVHVRDTIAHKLGYPSFVELGYQRMMRLDYDESDVDTYREQILNTVVPLVEKIHRKQAKRIGLDHLTYYDAPIFFSDGNAKPEGTPEEILANGQKMYHELSPQTGAFIDFMMERDLFDVLSRQGKQMGGYCTYIEDYQSPFVFANFNGTADDLNVLTHEAGHAFQIYQSRWIDVPECAFPTYESCEIHSMSMEFFTWPYMDKFVGKQADKYRYQHLSDAVAFLPYGVLVDHFQHEVYRHPQWSAQKRREVWRELEKQYKPDTDYESDPLLNQGGFYFRQGHIFESPFYYIDYTLAQVCAFQFWKRQFVDHDPKAWQDYLAICKVGGTQSFLQIVHTANLASPFTSGSLDAVMSAIDQWLDGVDDTKL